MSEVPLYHHVVLYESKFRSCYYGFELRHLRKQEPSGSFNSCKAIVKRLQGYLTYKKTHLLGPYRRPMPRVLRGSGEGGGVLVSEVPLQGDSNATSQKQVQSRRDTVARAPLRFRCMTPSLSAYAYTSSGEVGTFDP